MNNRNQQTARSTAPAEVTAPTYLNVFTVEEYESNGKTGKKWTKIVLPPDTDDANSRSK
jgi:hypothetical protein